MHTWNIFYHSAFYIINTILQKLNPSANGKGAMVFVVLVAIGKQRNWGILITPLRSECALLNAGKTVLEQFTNVRSFHRGFYKWKMMDNDKKVYSVNGLAIDTKFFHFVLPILVCTMYSKGAVGAVCALPRNWQLGAYLPITVRDGAVT